MKATTFAVKGGRVERYAFSRDDERNEQAQNARRAVVASLREEMSAAKESESKSSRWSYMEMALSSASGGVDLLVARTADGTLAGVASLIRNETEWWMPFAGARGMDVIPGAGAAMVAAALECDPSGTRTLNLKQGTPSDFDSFSHWTREGFAPVFKGGRSFLSLHSDVAIGAAPIEMEYMSAANIARGRDIQRRVEQASVSESGWSMS